MVASSRRPGVISKVASTAWTSIIASAARPVRVSSDDSAHLSAALSSAGRGAASAERTRVSAASHCPAAVSVLTVVAVRADRSGSDSGVSASARVARSAAARGVNGSSSATALSSPARATASPGRAPLSRRCAAGTAEPPRARSMCPNCQCRACWTGFGSSCATACRTNSCWNASPSGVATRDARTPPHRDVTRRPATGSVSPRRPRSGRVPQEGSCLGELAGARGQSLQPVRGQYLDPLGNLGGRQAGSPVGHGDGVLVEQTAEGLGEYKEFPAAPTASSASAVSGTAPSTSLISAIWALGRAAPGLSGWLSRLRAGRRAALRCQRAVTWPWRGSRTAVRGQQPRQGPERVHGRLVGPLDIVNSHQDGTRRRQLLQPGEHRADRGRRGRRGVNRAEQRCQRRGLAQLISDRSDRERRRSRASLAAAESSRDFPVPGSPSTSRILPWPSAVLASRLRTTSYSAARPRIGLASGESAWSAMVSPQSGGPLNLSGH